MATDPSHRIIISESELTDTIESLRHYQHEHGLNSPAKKFLAKLVVLQAKIGVGVASPAYVTSGVREAKKITVDNLGFSEADLIAVSTPNRVSPTLAGMGEDEMFAELERQEKEMLQELAAEGNQNVILAERRATPRELIPDKASADNELFQSL